MLRKEFAPGHQWQTKAGHFKVKAEDVLEDGTFTGYGSVFNVKDRGMDIVLPGAFAESLAEHKRRGTVPALLWQHNPDEPVGLWLEFKEDGRGLWCKGKLLTEFEKGRQAHVLMKHGALSGLSIGYDCQVWEWDESGRESVRRLKQIELWEVSVVTFPMCPEARVETVKRGAEAQRARLAAPPDHSRELADLARAVKSRDQALRTLR